MATVPTLHATAVSRGGHAVLIRGAPGSGKSDLALRLIGTSVETTVAMPFLLVADDRVVIERAGGRLVASAPPALRGKLEVRGVGIVELTCVERAEVALCIDLAEPDRVPRMPEPERAALAGLAIPLLRLWPFEASATLKVHLALDAVLAGRL